MNKLSSVQDFDRCVKCGHRATIEGICQVGVTGPLDPYGRNPICGCKCVFPSPSVSEAAPEVIWMNPRLAGLHALPEHMRDPDDTVQYARVHQPPEQNSEDKNLVSGASNYSTFRIPKDIALTLAEIRERRAGWYSVDKGQGAWADIDTLLSIIDTLQRAIPLAAFESHKIDGRIAESISQCAASNMKAELIKRVQERAAEIEAAYDARDGISTIPVGAAAQLTRLAIELETVELTQDTKSALRGHNPNRGTSVRNHTESESVPDVQAADVREIVFNVLFGSAHANLSSDTADLLARRIAESLTSPVQPEVSKALKELREMFPDVQIIISVRDCGEETTTVRGTTLEYGIQVGMNGQEFDEDTLTEAIAKVREWKEQDNAKS